MKKALFTAFIFFVVRLSTAHEENSARMEGKSMQTSKYLLTAIIAVAGMLSASFALAQGDDGEMNFFVTSAGLDGANFGGLDGADISLHCRGLT